MTNFRVAGIEAQRYIVVDDFYLSGDDGRHDTPRSRVEWALAPVEPPQAIGLPDLQTNKLQGDGSKTDFSTSAEPDRIRGSKLDQSTTVDDVAVERAVENENDATDFSISTTQHSQDSVTESSHRKAGIATAPALSKPTLPREASLVHVKDVASVNHAPGDMHLQNLKRKRNASPTDQGYEITADIHDPRKRKQPMLRSEASIAQDSLKSQVPYTGREFDANRSRPALKEAQTSRKEQNIAQTTLPTQPGLRKPYSPWAAKARAAGKTLQPIPRALKLSTLASVTGANCSKNKVVDILARIASVDEATTKPKSMPLKREMRISDASTDKEVTVSIFVDPEGCVPVPGDLVLMRNLVTHDWKGGRLSVYPAYCDGKDWYIPETSIADVGSYPQLEAMKAKILAKEGLKDG